MDLRSAASVVPSAAEWLVPHRYGQRIPLGMLTIWAGAPGVNKSTASCDLVAEVSKEGHVLLSNTEDAEGALRLRLEVCGANLDNIDFATPFFPRDMDAIIAMMYEKGTKLVVLDPIAAHFGGLIYQEAEFRAMLKPLREAMEATDCVILGIHHTIGRIRKKDHPLRALGGPQGSLKGSARSVWVFGPSPDEPDERVLAYVKDNCGTTKDSLLMELEFEEVMIPKRAAPVPVARLNVVAQDCDITAEQVIHGDDRSEAHRQIKRSAAAQWLTTYLSAGPQPQKDLKAAALTAGHSYTTIRRAGHFLNIIKSQTGGGKGSYTTWRLPDDHPALLKSMDLDADIQRLLDENA